MEKNLFCFKRNKNVKSTFFQWQQKKDRERERALYLDIKENKERMWFKQSHHAKHYSFQTVAPW